MLRVKRITNIDALAERVAKPRGAVPEFGLPKWKMMPLENKIPMIPAPENAYNLVRRKVGRKLWMARTKFDLSDPYCREINFSYEPLHDEHLREFFSKPVNTRRLLKAGLITDDMSAICSLRDYNTYRAYLRMIHAERMKKELRREYRLFTERRALRFAEDQAREEAKRLEEKKRLGDVKQRVVQQRLLEEKSKIDKQKEKAHKAAQRLKLLRQVRQEQQKLMSVKREERAEQNRHKCKIAADIARRKAISISKEWERKEKVRAKAMEQRSKDIEQQKRKSVEEKWKRKQDYQEKDIAKEKILLQHLNTRRQLYIVNYIRKVNKESVRMQRHSDNVKLFISCYMKRYLPDGRKRICCRKYFRNNTTRKGDNIKKDSPMSTHHSRKLTNSKRRKLQIQ